MSKRPAEAVYVRFILDEAFAARVRESSDASAFGLTDEERARLLVIPQQALTVERRGRQASLWERVKVQLPSTARPLELHLVSNAFFALRNAYFADAFWDFDRTLDLRPYGRGWEMASTFAAFLDGRRDDALVDLAADVSIYEKMRFEARTASMLPSPPDATEVGRAQTAWDVFAVAADPRLSPDEARLVRPIAYRVDAGGGVSLLRAPDASWDAVELADDVIARLSSYRLDHYHASSTMYFPLGERAEALNAAHRALERAPEDDASLGGVFERDGQGFVLNETDYFAPTPHVLCGENEHLVIERRDGAQRLRIPLTQARLDGLHGLMASLRASTPLDDVKAAAGPELAAFLEQLLDIGFVAPAPLRRPPVRRDHRVTFVGHSGVLVESPSSRVMVDPFLVVRNRPAFNPLRAVLGTPLDAVVIIHAHWDHLNLDSLLHLSRSTRVVVPARRHRSSIVNPDMGQMVRDLGFSDVVELPPWGSTTVGEGEGAINVTALPYYGETTGPGAPRDWLTARLRCGGRELMFLVDACRDPWGSTDEMVHEAAQRFGRVDVLFAPSADFRYPQRNYTRRPFFFGDGVEPYTGGPQDAARWAAISGACVLVPYAMFHLLAGDAAGDAAACAADRFRFGGLRELQQLVAPAPAGPLCPLEPGDRISWGGPSLPGARPLVDGMWMAPGGGR